MCRSQLVRRCKGPWFGVEAYDANGNAPIVDPLYVGAVGMDSKTGAVTYQQATSGFFLPSSLTLSFNQWHHFQLILDYSQDAYFA